MDSSIIPIEEIHQVLTVSGEWHTVDSCHIATIMLSEDGHHDNSTPITMLFWQGNGPCTDYYGVPIANIQGIRFSRRDYTSNKVRGGILEVLQRPRR